jgi:hypothetical protein
VNLVQGILKAASSNRKNGNRAAVAQGFRSVAALSLAIYEKFRREKYPVSEAMYCKNSTLA